MSDFDKEAERERLREKYERDQQKRESTERMSELLLKGATMTNAHCDDCGDPIFRYDGQEFCPTCQQPVETGEEGNTAEDTEAADADETGGESGSEPDDLDVEPVKEQELGAAEQSSAAAADPQDSAGQPSQSGGTASEPDTAATNGAPAPDSVASPDTAGARSADREAETSNTPAPAHRGAAPSETKGQGVGGTGNVSSAPAAPADGSIADARDALVSALATQSQRAAATEDPRRARDHLEAAREAAEALAALSEVR